MQHFVKIGIIGCGWIIEHAYLPVLIQESRGKIVALFDPNGKRLKELENKWGITKTYDNLKDFFESEVEAVIIATPNSTHFYYTLEALKCGIHVLCEKPVAFHFNEIRQIMQASKENDAIYVPGFVNRWREDIQSLCQTTNKGKIGKIEKMEAGWLRKTGVPRPGTWFTSRRLAGGGVLMDLGPHIVDICLLCLGEREPVSYELTSSICNSEKIKSLGGASWFHRNDPQEFNIDVEDSAIVDVGFKDNITLNIKLSWCAPVKGDCTYFRLYGTHGEIQLRTLFGFSNNRLWEKDVLEVTENGVKTRTILNEDKNSAKEAFAKMIANFIESILNHKAEFIDVKDAGKTVSLIENLYKVENRNSLKVEENILEEF